MRKAYLKFMEHVVSIDCPFFSFSVKFYRSYIEVRFIIASSLTPEDLGWLNTHLLGGRWFLTAEEDSVIIVVRFEETNED